MRNEANFRTALAAVSRRALAIGLGGLVLATPALAQDPQQDPDSQDEGGAIIVTGFKQSLIAAADEKRLSDLILESVTSEDIGQLPDISIAESIARLPGVTTQRLDGRAQVITIRGLAPDFSTTLLNGRQQVTTGDNRGVEYDQYPSQIVSRVDVYKTTDATLVGQGLSGTVDLQTIRPLAYQDRTITVQAQGEYILSDKQNVDSTNWGYRASGIYIDQFAEDTFGVMLGVSYSSVPNQIERFNAWGYPDIAPDVRVIGGSKPYAKSADLDRIAVVGTLQYAPSENFETTLDIYYSNFKEDQTLRGIEFPLQWSAAQLQPQRTVEDGLVVEGQFNGVKGVVRNDANTRDANLWSIGWNTKAGNDVMRAMFDLSYSGVKREDLILETYAGTGRGPVGATDNLGFEMVKGGAVFDSKLIDYASYQQIVLTSPQGWGGDIIPGGQDGYYNQRSIEDDLWSFRVEFERDLKGGFKNVQFGMNYAIRDKSLTPDEYFLQLKANTNGTTSVPVPPEFRLGTTKLDFIGIPGMISYNPVDLVNSGIYNFVRNPNADVNTKGWSVSEDVITGYAQVNLDGVVGGRRLTGNVGMQVVVIDQSSKGLASSGTGTGVVTTEIEEGTSNTYVLPSFNLAYRWDEGLVVRVAGSRQLAQPRLDDMRASINFNYDPSLAGSTNPTQSPWSGSGGNPFLEPWLAWAADVSIEKYINDQGAYVALAGFYKYLESYIYNQSVFYDFTGFPIPGGPPPAINIGLVTTPQNGQGGNLYGMEISGNYPFGDSGFGITGNYSYTSSSITPDPNNPAQPLPGLSKNVASGTVWFEKWGFTARTSVRYRSEFLGEIRAFGGGNERRLAAGEVIVDASIGYDFTEGALNGLSLQLQGYNLNNEPFWTFVNGDQRQVQDYETYGRRLIFSALYRF